MKQLYAPVSDRKQISRRKWGQTGYTDCSNAMKLSTEWGMVHYKYKSI